MLSWKSGLVSFLSSRGRDVDWMAEAILTQVRVAGFTAGLEAGAHARRGLLQTFDPRVVRRWKQLEPSHPVLFLWSTDRLAEGAPPCKSPDVDCADLSTLSSLLAVGVDVLAPAMPLLLSSDGHRLNLSDGMRQLQTLVADSGGAAATGTTPPTAPTTARIGTWSFERSGCPSANTTARLGNQPARTGPCGFYWEGLQGGSAFEHADALLAVDILLEAGVAGIFSDFPATVSAVANCRRRHTDRPQA